MDFAVALGAKEYGCEARMPLLPQGLSPGVWSHRDHNPLRLHGFLNGSSR